MKTKGKLLELVTGGALLIILLTPTISNAALQANGNGSSKKNIDQWMSSIRAMEAQGGTLGLNGSSSLNEVPGEDGKVPNSNNLDIHMQKNTEYGAMAILSASNYGKSTPVHETSDGSLSTTTGNKSGVYIQLNKEWVAAGSGLGDKVANFKKAIGKYKNVYPTSYASKAGDAIIETKNWHTTGGQWQWIPNNSYNISCGVLRAYSGSLFSYYGAYTSSSSDSIYSKEWFCRAVVIVGNGF